MVLKQRGVTLIELMVSIALSGLVATLAIGFFKDAGHAAHLSQGRQEGGFQAHIFFNGLTENVLAGGGVLKLGEGTLIILNNQNRKVTYSWADSILSVNGNPQKMRIADLKIEPMGPERPNREGSNLDWSSPWDLDSLDEDRDGRIDFEELDRDHSDDLDPNECRFVAEYRLSLSYVEGGQTSTLTAIIHPRNHLAALAAKNWDQEQTGDGFSGF